MVGFLSFRERAKRILQIKGKWLVVDNPLDKIKQRERAPDCLHTGTNSVDTCHRFIHQNAINYLICSILKFTFKVFKYFWWSPLLPSWSVFLYKPCHGSLHIFIDGKYILFLAKKIFIFVWCFLLAIWRFNFFLLFLFSYLSFRRG